MTLTNLKTVTTKTATVTSVKLFTPADRIGLGFGAGHAYPTDTLSPNPATEQVRSRQGQSAAQMRKQMRADGPVAVPPVGSAGCLTPGPRAVCVRWPLTAGTCWSVIATHASWTRASEVRAVRVRIGRDCQSPDRTDGNKANLLRAADLATIAGK